jgi:hypothetical protein
MTRQAMMLWPHSGRLGWIGICEGGSAARQAGLPGLEDITVTLRKYGFHGMLKPLFGLAEGRSVDELQVAVADSARHDAPARRGGLT